MTVFRGQPWNLRAFRPLNLQPAQGIRHLAPGIYYGCNLPRIMALMTLPWSSSSFSRGAVDPG